MRGALLHCIVCGLALLVSFAAATSALRAAPQDTSADAVLGQPDFVSVDPNQPAFLPTAQNLALSNAAHVALAANGRMYVADADNHRVLSWPDAAAFTTGAPADMVIGQANFSGNAPNRGLPAGAGPNTFFLPQGLSVDDAGHLWVADAFNNRVLRFNDPAQSDGIADLVIGQRDFSSNGPNLGQGDRRGDNPASALPDSLLFPGRVIARDGHVWISDSGNSRVLHYAAPAVNKPVADLVLGQFGDFTRRAKNNDGAGEHGDAPSAGNLFNCIGIALDAYGNLYVADWQNHRVVRYDDPLNSDDAADAVFGQPDFASGLPDQGGLTSGLQLPIDLHVDAAGALNIADSFNHRVLVYHDPLHDQSTADAVYGQLGSFDSDLINHGLGPFTSDADALFGPTGLASDAALNLFIVDTNSNRLLRFDTVRAAAAAADFDLDGDVDLADHARLVDCLEGPGQEVDVACRVPDLDADLNVDLADFARLQRCFSGSGIPANANCAN